jgi:hypothetical protein
VPRKLVLSIAEAAEALGVSDDLIYELGTGRAAVRPARPAEGHSGRRHPGRH